ncbi:MAG: nuclear transport factor 2 family protein [Candidatus Korobacteraceae bacterium]
MKMFSLLVMVGLCCTALAQTPAPAKGNSEEEVSKVQQQWLEAEQHGDAAVLDRILDDDFVGSGPGGDLLQKSDLVIAAPGSQPRSFLNENLADTTAKAFGKTVVVLGKLVDSNDKTHQTRFSMVYVKRADQWRMVAAQLVPVVTQ